MEARTWHTAGNTVSPRLDLAAQLDESFGELEHVLVARLEFLAVLLRQPTDPDHVLVAAGEILDLAVLVEKAPHDVLREIDELRAAQKHVIFELALFCAHAHPAPFVVQRGIEIAAARDRIADHLVLTAPI